VPGHAVDSQDGGPLVRVGVGSIAAGFAAMAIGVILYAWMTLGTVPATAGLRSGARLSVFGTIHPKLYDLGSATYVADVPDSRRVRLASFETGGDSQSTFRQPDNESGPSPAAMAARSTFGERFSFAQPSPPSRSLQASVSFDDRFTGAISVDRATVQSAAVAPRVSAPSVAMAAAAPPRAAARSIVAQATPKRPAGQFQLASASDTPLPPAYAPADSVKDSGIADSVLKDLAPKDSNPLANVDTSHTAIYDITAHTVYLPNGQRLEAHSGLGEHMDDPRYVNVRMTGPTPPNIYELKPRERIFHGVRALRLNPVDGGKMHGRDGILAHSYMLGPNGQSNGCVSFNDYQAFLNAYLRGDIDHLVVVEHLADAPSPKTASDWFSNTLKSIFQRS
jgi:hypothetical protein